MMTDYHELQRLVLCAQDFESLAQTKLDSPLFSYVSGGSGDEQTLRRNRKAFTDIALMPNSLEDVSQGHSKWTLDSTTFSAPILLAPVAHQALAHDLGELASAEAAEAINQGMIVSTLSSYSLESISHASHGWKAFQLYAQSRMDDSYDLIRRAKNAGYQRLVITVDAPIQSVALAAKKQGFQLPNTLPANLEGYPAPALTELYAGDSFVFQGLMAKALNWDSLAKLVEFSQALQLPVWIKGVLNPEQAVRLKALGVEGFIVSNHGGRALDGAPSALEMLPSIRTAVGEGSLVLLDSGIRNGRDIFTALALGADAVLIGRLQMYALAVAGAMGVAHLLRLLTEELQLTMALCGCAEIHQITPSALYR